MIVFADINGMVYSHHDVPRPVVDAAVMLQQAEGAEVDIDEIDSKQGGSGKVSEEVNQSGGGCLPLLVRQGQYCWITYFLAQQDNIAK